MILARSTTVVLAGNFGLYLEIELCFECVVGFEIYFYLCSGFVRVSSMAILCPSIIVRPLLPEL